LFLPVVQERLDVMPSKYLVKQGHEVLNLDQIPFPDPSLGVYTLKTDITKSGQVFNALTAHYGYKGFDTQEHPPAPPDVLVHYAAFSTNNMVPDNLTFEANTISTYNVIEAAAKLGVKKIIIASSETTYGVCFAQGDKDYHSFPLEEDYDNDPMDSYALSKICGEKIARAFARRFNIDIYALRIGNVIIPSDYETRFAEYVKKPETRKRNAWSYIDARDLGQITSLAIDKDGLGFQVFNATNDTSTLTVPTAQYLKENFPHVPITRELGEYEAPLSNRKTKEVLGFKEEHDWRKYVTL